MKHHNIDQNYQKYLTYNVAKKYTALCHFCILVEFHFEFLKKGLFSKLRNILFYALLFLP